MAENVETLTIRVNAGVAQKALSDLGKIDAFEKAVAGGRAAATALSEARAKAADLKQQLQQADAGSALFSTLTRQAKAAEQSIEKLQTRFKAVSREIVAQAGGLAASKININDLGAARASLQKVTQLQEARVVLRLDKSDEAKARIDQLRVALAQLKASGVGTMDDIRRATYNANREIAALEDELRAGSGGGEGLFASLLGRGGGPLAIAAGFAAITAKAVGTADALAEVNGKLRLVTSSEAERVDLQKQIFDVAQQTNTGYADNVVLFTKLAQAGEGLFSSQNDILSITKLVNQSFRISGATSEEAAAGVLQFGQALQSGVLQGDELRSIREAAPRLFNAIVDGIQRIDPALGVTKGNFKQLASEGKITAQLVSDALLTQTEAVNAEAQKLPQTLGTAFQGLRNEVGQLAGDIGGPLQASLIAATRAATSLVAAINQLPTQVVRAPAAGGFEGGIGSGLAKLSQGRTLDEVFDGAKPRAPLLFERGAQNVGSVQDVIKGIGQPSSFDPGSAFRQQFGNAAIDKETAALREQLALRKLNTEEERARYKITVGSLKDESNERKNAEIELAKQKDSEDAADAADKAAKKGASQRLKDLRKDQKDAEKEAREYAAAREEAARAEEAFQKELGDTRIRLLEVTGQTEKARLAQLDARYQPLFATAENRGDDAATGLLNQAYRAETGGIRADAIDEALRKAQGAFNQRRDTIQVQTDTGATTETEARARLRKAQSDYLAVVTAINERIEQSPELIPAERLETLRGTIAQIRAELGTLDDPLLPFKQTLDSVFRDGLVTALQDLTSGTRGAGDAFKELGRTILRELQNTAIRQAVNQLTDYIKQKFAEVAASQSSGGAGGSGLGSLLGTLVSAGVSYFTGGASTSSSGASSGFFTASSASNGAGGFNLSGFADGGLVRGPGTGKSDSILARVSRGEFIVTAEAVKRIGPQWLQALNAGLQPRIPAFADGGLVGSLAAVAPGRAGASTAITVNLGGIDARGATDPSGIYRAGQVLEANLTRKLSEMIKRGTL